MVCCSFVLALVTNVCVVFAISLDDVCDANDIHCLQQNINGFGNIKYDRCYTDNVLRRIQDITLLNCIKECFKTANCTSVNFRLGWNICDINGGAPLGEEFVQERGCLFSFISEWPKALGGICKDHDCLEGQICKRKVDDTVQCEESYCKAKPCIRNAEIAEKFGLYKSIGHGIKYVCVEGYKISGRPFAVCERSGNWKILFTCLPISAMASLPTDCTEVLGNKSGIYKISPTGGLAFHVYCDMDTVGGGWTVFQNRYDGSVDFFRGWSEYENGFGCLDQEFWLGNRYLSMLTATGSYELRVDLMDTAGEKRYAEYSHFKINDAEQKYSIEVSGYSGNADDSLQYQNGYKFTTKDQKNDIFQENNCAVTFKGAWWYAACHLSNLNGLYLNGSHTEHAVGMNWFTWKGYHYSLMRTKMMLRKKDIQEA